MYLSLYLLGFNLQVLGKAHLLFPEVLVQVTMLHLEHAQLVHDLRLVVLRSKVLPIEHLIKQTVSSLLQRVNVTCLSASPISSGSPKSLNSDQLDLKLPKSLLCVLLRDLLSCLFLGWLLSFFLLGACFRWAVGTVLGGWHDWLQDRLLDPLVDLMIVEHEAGADLVRLDQLREALDPVDGYLPLEGVNLGLVGTDSSLLGYVLAPELLQLSDC